MYLNADHIEKMLQDGKLVISSSEISRGFSEYINRLKWNDSGACLDFDRIPHLKLNLAMDDAIDKWINELTIGRYKRLFFFFNEIEPCLVSELVYGLKNIDHVYWGAPGVRFMFFGDIVSEQVKPIYEQFIMYDGSETIFVKL